MRQNPYRLPLAKQDIADGEIYKMLLKAENK